MTPKEKAEELIKKFRFESLADWSDSIQCAIITVDAVLEIHPNTLLDEQEEYKFWEQVKQELTNKTP